MKKILVLGVAERLCLVRSVLRFSSDQQLPGITRVQHAIPPTMAPINLPTPGIGLPRFVGAVHENSPPETFVEPKGGMISRSLLVQEVMPGI